MDVDLLKNAIEFHGKQLHAKLREVNTDEMLGFDNSGLFDGLDNNEKKSDGFSDEISLLKSASESAFYESLTNFICKKAKVLFKSNLLDRKPIESNENELQIDEELYPTMPSLEKFMSIPAIYAKTHFFEYLEIGDVVIGSITSVSDRGLYVQLISFDIKTDKRREMEFLKIIAFCSIFDLQQFAGAKAVANFFQQNDLIRCLVKTKDEIKETCDVWFGPSENEVDKSIKLGLISSAECHLYYHHSRHFEKHSSSQYGSLLRREKSFNNSGSVNLLTKKFNLKTKYSLMSGLNNFEVKPEEMAIELRKTQTRNLALQSVARGIKLFKENQASDAMIQYNRALSIDEENVEGFVARGALFASNGDFTKAIVDLENALRLDSKHLNAKTYLREVLADRAVFLEKSESYGEAAGFYEKLVGLEENESKKVVLNDKVKQMLEKKKQLKLKNYYGPQLPSSSSSSKNKSKKKSSKKKRKRSNSTISISSTSSSSSSASSLPKEQKRQNETETKVDKSHKVEHHRSRHSESTLNRSYVRQRSSRSRSRRRSYHEASAPKRRSRSRDNKKNTHKTEDDEDLEAFYNKLKQKAATKGKR